MDAPASKQAMASSAISVAERGTWGLRSLVVTPLMAASIMTGSNMAPPPSARRVPDATRGVVVAGVGPSPGQTVRRSARQLEEHAGRRGVGDEAALVVGDAALAGRDPPAPVH